MLWNERRRQRYAEDLAYRQRRRASNAASWRKHKYGLSPKEYYALVARQGGACAICRKIKPLCVDHCHLTGEVRGLLCSTCNSALGFWGDSPIVVRRALKYLETAGGNARGRRRERRVIQTRSRAEKPTRRSANRRSASNRISPRKGVASSCMMRSRRSRHRAAIRAACDLMRPRRSGCTPIKYDTLPTSPGHHRAKNAKGERSGATSRRVLRPDDPCRGARRHDGLRGH
jgi:hypothetical protein